MPLLDSSKRKVQGILETIKQVRELDFPFEHSLDALSQFESTFLELRETLDSLGPANDIQIIKNFCRETLSKTFELLPLIGFIASSSEISGPVEFHGPFLRLVRQSIGSNAKLVISSDWQYSPYTYIFPNYLDDLGLVMVGIPVSESDNALVTPVAGHELGHNIWALERLNEQITPSLYAHVMELMEGKYWERVKAEHLLVDKAQLKSDMFGLDVWKNALIWATAQAEETFCDLVGMYTFRESYIHAFEYLLSPWGLPRQPTYPSMYNRILTLCEAAEAETHKIEIPPDFRDSFAKDDTDAIPLMLEIADEVVQLSKGKLIALAKSVCTTKSIMHAPLGIDEVVQSLKLGIPAHSVSEFQTIINAGWIICVQIDATWEDKRELRGHRAKKHEFLNELLLKSLETHEIEQIQKGAGC